MPNGLVLSQHDKELLTILVDYGINTSLMACEFSRQQSEGIARFKGAMRRFGDGTYKISYDLMLCTYCGNLLPQTPCCPAKFMRFKQPLIQQYLQERSKQPVREMLLLPAWREPLLLPQLAGN